MSPLFASAPPPGPGTCAVIAVILGLILFGICAIFFGRMERHDIPYSFCRRIILGALIGGLGGAVAGPVAFNNENFPHWIGFTARDAMLRSFVGAIIGICMAAVFIRLFRDSSRTKRITRALQFQLSDLLILVPLVSIGCALIAKSMYVSSFVFLELAICVLACVVAVQFALSRHKHVQGNVERSGAA